MNLILYFLGGAIAFVAGMVAYRDIHAVYHNRDAAKRRRQRDHRAVWCVGRVV